MIVFNTNTLSDNGCQPGQPNWVAKAGAEVIAADADSNVNDNGSDDAPTERRSFVNSFITD